MRILLKSTKIITFNLKSMSKKNDIKNASKIFQSMQCKNDALINYLQEEHGANFSVWRPKLTKQSLEYTLKDSKGKKSKITIMDKNIINNILKNN